MVRIVALFCVSLALAGCVPVLSHEYYRPEAIGGKVCVTPAGIRMNVFSSAAPRY
jgi:hypothetical protein